MLERRRAELRAERVIEVRNVAIAAHHGNVDDARIVRREADRGVAQPRTRDVAVRREAGDAREGAHEVEPAQVRFAGKRLQASVVRRDRSR